MLVYAVSATVGTINIVKTVLPITLLFIVHHVVKQFVRDIVWCRETLDYFHNVKINTRGVGGGCEQL